MKLSLLLMGGARYRGESARHQAGVQDVEHRPDGGNKTVDQLQIQRSVQTGRARYRQLIELRSRRGPAHVDVERPARTLKCTCR